MLNDIKAELLRQPDSIVNILESFDFYKPRIQHNEIRCGLYEGSNPTAICIRLVNNDKLYVNDFSRNISKDIISYIITVRDSNFIAVLKAIKEELGIDDFESIGSKRSVFGGFYDRIRKQQSDLYVKVYNDSLLNDYIKVYNKRFIDDRIGLQAQDFFEIGYDSESQRITIPIRNAYGELIGIKSRANYEVTEDEPKYLYLVPCAMSTTLYGYCYNYPYLQNNTIYIFESEKAVMQAYSYGIRNCVALGGNSLSSTQSKLLMSLAPKQIIFMLDKGLEFESTERNYERLSAYTRMSDVQVLWWDWTLSDLPDKSSPTDYGKECFIDIIENQLRPLKEDNEDEEEI